MLCCNVCGESKGLDKTTSNVHSGTTLELSFPVLNNLGFAYVIATVSDRDVWGSDTSGDSESLSFGRLLSNSFAMEISPEPRTAVFSLGRDSIRVTVIFLFRKISTNV